MLFIIITITIFSRIIIGIDKKLLIVYVGRLDMSLVGILLVYFKLIRNTIKLNCCWLFSSVVGSVSL